MQVSTGHLPDAGLTASALYELPFRKFGPESLLPYPNVLKIGNIPDDPIKKHPYSRVLFLLFRDYSPKPIGF